MSLGSTLKKSKTFLKKGQFLNNDISYNPNYFLTSWSDTIGYLNIKSFNKKNFPILKKYKIIFREFFSIKRDKLKLRYNTDENNYENLILTYFFPKNLKKDGSYFDRYFSLNTKLDKKNTMWVLIPVNENKFNNKNNRPIIIERINGFKNKFLIKLNKFTFFFVDNSRKKAITDNKIIPSINMILATCVITFC